MALSHLSSGGAERRPRPALHRHRLPRCRPRGPTLSPPHARRPTASPRLREKIPVAAPPSHGSFLRLSPGRRPVQSSSAAACECSGVARNPRLLPPGLPPCRPPVLDLCPGEVCYIRSVQPQEPAGIDSPGPPLRLLVGPDGQPGNRELAALPSGGYDFLSTTQKKGPARVAGRRWRRRWLPLRATAMVLRGMDTLAEIAKEPAAQISRRFP